jgi:phosphoribosylformimino-5-aminoimidazole carboxamide ribotide isomerase
VELYPAVDLLEGGAVRLRQGDFAARTDFGDPLALARSYRDGGARWVHVVDLDAARRGRPVQRDLVAALVSAVAPLHVQVGGGVRSAEDVEALLALGAARVVVGTLAATDPGAVRELAATYPGRVALGLDHRGGQVATEGWRSTSGQAASELLASLAGAPLGAVVVTAIDRDGTLEGPDLAGLAAVLVATEVPVVASGGVGSLEDLRQLAALRVGGRRLAGVVVGRALAEGAMSVEEALAACASSE